MSIILTQGVYIVHESKTSNIFESLRISMTLAFYIKRLQPENDNILYPKYGYVNDGFLRNSDDIILNALYRIDI